MRDCKQGEQQGRGQEGIIIVRGRVEGAVLFSKSKSRVGVFYIRSLYVNGVTIIGSQIRSG